MTDWSDWIKHDGKGCPVPFGTMVTVVYRNGSTEVCFAMSRGGGSWDWSNESSLPIIRYRTRIYRAGTDLIESVRELEPA